MINVFCKTLVDIYKKCRMKPKETKETKIENKPKKENNKIKSQKKMQNNNKKRKRINKRKPEKTGWNCLRPCLVP